MIEDTLDQAADQVGIRAAAVFPLGVDLNQDNIVGSDQTVGFGLLGGILTLKKGQFIRGHQRQQGIDPGMVVRELEALKG